MSSVVETPSPQAQSAAPPHSSAAPARRFRPIWKIAAVVLVVLVLAVGTLLTLHWYNSYAVSLNPPGIRSYPAPTEKANSGKPKTTQASSGQNPDATDSAASGDKAGSGGKSRAKATATPGA